MEEIKKLLIIVDMVNGFVREGLLHDKNIENIIKPQIEILEYFIKNNYGVILLKDSHTKESEELKRLPNHCISGETESDLIDELKSYEKKSIIIEKNSTCALFVPTFKEKIYMMQNLKEIVVTGCCTDICVLNLVIALRNYFDQFNKKIDIIVPTNCVDTYNNVNHNREDYNNMAFKLMEQGGIKLVKKYKEGNIYAK